MATSATPADGTSPVKTCLPPSRPPRAGQSRRARSAPGTGTVALGFKGGIGTSSRRLPPQLGGCTVGVLVQTNFGGVLTMAGAPVGRELGRHFGSEEHTSELQSRGHLVCRLL